MLASTDWPAFVDYLLDAIFNADKVRQKGLFDKKIVFTYKPSIIKQINKQSNTIEWKDFCRSYYLFAFEYFSKDNENNENNEDKETFEERRKFMKEIIIAYNIKMKWKKVDIEPTPFDLKFTTNISSFYTKILTPLLDLYFMLRMWKNVDTKNNSRNNNPSWLTVLNAGNFHTDMLIYYLTTKGKMYKFSTISKCNGIIGSAYTDFTKGLSLKETSNTQCIDFNDCKLNLDLYNPNKAEIDSINLRLKIFGTDIFNDMLLHNKAFTYDELCKLINLYNDKNNSQDKHSCDEIIKNMSLTYIER